MRIFFLIRSLEHGGAERQLIELVKALDRTRFRVTVATFYDGGALRPQLEGIDGIHLLSLRKRGRWDVFPFLMRLLRAVREARPDVIHGYLGVANELALLVGRLQGSKVVWGLRMSTMDWSKHEWIASLTDRAGAWLSRFPELLIANSEAGRDAYLAAGYRGTRMVVVPNGIDTDYFRPDPAARRRVRAEWGLVDDDRLIGTVGRLDPQKDQLTFLRAAAALANRRADVRFVVVGDGPASFRADLEQASVQLGLGGRLRWVRGTSDMAAVDNAFDLASLTSAYGEGFPNVIGEAMACGVPVVATAVGDAPQIVGSPRQVVAPRDPTALADAWERILGLPEQHRKAVGEAGRERVISSYSVKALVARSSTLFESLR